MKKILSLVVFLAALVWTWRIVRIPAPVPFETHAAIQGKLAELILTSLIEKRPNAENIKIEKIWTENQVGEKVKAIFAYSFREKFSSSSSHGSPEGENAPPELDEKPEVSMQTIEGEAILERQVSTDPSQDNWKLLEVKLTRDEVSYQEGLDVDSSVMPSR